MKRLLISQLLKWKDSHGRKPLIQEGARQVGSHQSLAIREKQQFKNHQHPLYMLFVLDKELEAELSNVV